MEKKNSIAATVAELQETLVWDNRDAILNAVRKYLRTWHVSQAGIEQMAEAAWDHVYEQRSKYTSDKGEFIGWAKKAAKNFCISLLRAPKKDGNIYFEPLNTAELDDFGEPHSDVTVCEGNHSGYSRGAYLSREAFFADDCEAQASRRELLDALKAVVSTYEGRERVVIQMLMGERTKDEVIEVTGMSGGNVDTCACRLRQRLRADLQKAGYAR